MGTFWGVAKISNIIGVCLILFLFIYLYIYIFFLVGGQTVELWFCLI